jgi:hypothetical protein
LILSKKAVGYLRRLTEITVVIHDGQPNLPRFRRGLKPRSSDALAAAIPVHSSADARHGGSPEKMLVSQGGFSF